MKPAPTYRDLIPQLDGLRAVAVLLVLLYHVEAEWALLHVVSYRLVNGRLGVTIFFCLSGFLITRILLFNKENAVGLGSFWLRRAGRIFPIYWITLVVVGLVWGFDWSILGAATYTLNFLIPFWGLPAPPVDHSWSLCVEEHFYLLWPLLVALLPRRGSLAVACAVVAGGYVAAAGLTLVAPHLPGAHLRYLIYLGTPCQSAALALGALVAYGEASLRGRPWRLFFLAAVVLTLSRGLPALVGVAARRMPADWEPFTVWGQQTLLGFAIFLVALAAESGWAPLRELLQERRLVGLGRISYGVYLFHPPIYCALGVGYTEQLVGGNLRVLAAIGGTFLLAALSYRFIERPILNRVHRLTSFRAGGPRPAAPVLGLDLVAAE